MKYFLDSAKIEEIKEAYHTFGIDGVTTKMCIRDRVYSGVEFVEGKIGDQYVVAAKCGIGKVFAAICAEAMILKYDVDMIVNIGVAGTLTKDLNVLDVAVATNVLQHDMDTSPIGDPKGLLSGINMILLPADTKMVELMCSCLADRNIHYKKGNIATGDQFIATKEQKYYICLLYTSNIGYK